VSRENFQSLLISGLSATELKILFYLIDICNTCGFSTEDLKSIADFFNADVDNTRKRIAKLVKLEIIKTVEYNGRSGFMVSPKYCYQGQNHLRQFRIELWQKEIIHTKTKPRYFYGPSFISDGELKNNAVTYPWYWRKRYKKKT
jgi:hypothetical protein